MTATTTGTPVVDVIVTITLLRPNTSLKSSLEEAKGGAWRLPLLPICCVASEAHQKHVCFASDSHRKSGVLSYSAALSPVES